MIAAPGTSRFAGGTTITHRQSATDVRYIYDLRSPVTKSDLHDDDWRIHVTAHGDVLDALAYKHAGDARLWWVIADLNADVLEDPLRIPAGIRLIVPTDTFARRVGA